MAVSQEARPGTGADAESGWPPDFRAAVAGMRTARLRPEVFCEAMPAPQRIAPYASALSADVTVEGDEVGTGRIILLHDPAGNDAWDGSFRCVAYARAEIELEMITDPMLAEVGWTWLSDALAAHGASYTAASGSVTRVATESFGGMAEEGGTAQIEIRASWTPLPLDPDTPLPRRHPSRRGLGRAALHSRRSSSRSRRVWPSCPAAAASGDRGRELLAMSGEVPDPEEATPELVEDPADA